MSLVREKLTYQMGFLGTKVIDIQWSEYPLPIQYIYTQYIVILS